MGTEQIKPSFVEKVCEYEKIVTETGQSQERLLSALNGSPIGLIYFKDGGTMFIGIEDGMIGNLGRGLKVEIPSIEILKDPSSLKQHLLNNSELMGIKVIDMK